MKQTAGVFVAALFGACAAVGPPAGGAGFGTEQAAAERNEGGGPTAAVEPLPLSVRHALSVYDPHPDSAAVASVLEEWSSANRPGSAEDSLAAAGMWRRAGQTDLALAWLPDERSFLSVTARALLERARILFQVRQSDRVERKGETRGDLAAEGADAFWLACDHLDRPAMSALWHDLRGLATVDEQQAWSKLPVTDACPWVREFLDERAWRTASTPEERLATHYKRLHFVRASYRLSRPRLTRDLSDRLGRPDSLEVDDRGLIYLRMGPPDAIVTGFLNESWSYYRPERTRVYHFAPVSRRGRHVTLDDYRLLESFADAGGVAISRNTTPIGFRDRSNSYSARRALDRAKSIRVRLRRLASQMVAPGELRYPGSLRILTSEWHRIEADAQYAIADIPDVPAVTPLVSFEHEILRFRNRDGRYEVWILGAARSGDLTAQGAADGPGVRYEVEATLALLTPDGYERMTTRNTPVVRKALAAEEAIPIRLARTRLEPGEYPYSLALRDAQFGRGVSGNWAQDTIVVPEPVNGLPEVSDIAVAADSGGTWSRDEETWLSILPNHLVGQDGSLFTYFEVYGLQAEQVYDVEIRVIDAEADVELFEAQSPELTFAMNFRAEMPSEVGAPGRHSLRLDLGGTPRGSYLLAVRVVNRATGHSSLPRITSLHR